MPKRKYVSSKKSRLPRKKYKANLWNKAKPYAGAASGAALGFIGADVSGAYYGGLAGYEAGKASARAVKKAWKKSHKPKKSIAHATALKGAHDLTVSKLGQVKVCKYMSANNSKAKYKYRNINQFVVNISGTLESQGRQVVDYLEFMMPKKWATGVVSDLRADRTTIPDALFAFDPRYGYAYTGMKGEVARTYATDKFYLDNIQCQYGFVSLTTTPQIVDIYFVTPKKGINLDPLAHFNEVMAIERDGQRLPNNATAVATANAQSGGGDTDNWGQSPFALRDFRKMWKCLKKITITLAPGDQKHISLGFIFKKYIDQAFYNASENRYEFLPNLTVVPLVIAKAGLVGIRASEGAATTEVAYGQAKVGVMSDMVINCKAVKEKTDYHISRVYKGAIEATTEVQKEIDDNDNVATVELN